MGVTAPTLYSDNMLSVNREFDLCISDRSSNRTLARLRWEPDKDAFRCTYDVGVTGRGDGQHSSKTETLEHYDPTTVVAYVEQARSALTSASSD